MTLHKSHSRNPESLNLIFLKKLCFLTIGFERLSLHFWQVFALVTLFASLAMLDFLEFLGKTSSSLFLLCFSAGFLFFVYRGIRDFKWPEEKEILKRLERDSNLKHQPLLLKDDDPVSLNDNKMSPLWRLRRKRIESDLKTLKLPKLRLDLYQSDLYGLRFITLFLCVAGFFMAGPQWDERIYQSLFPVFSQIQSPLKERVKLVITPPEYTRLESLTLTKPDPKALKIPENSTLKAEIYGGLTKPVMKINQNAFDFEDIGNKTHIFESTLTEEHKKIQIKQDFLTKFSQEIVVIPDQAPKMSVSEEPEILTQKEIRLSLEIQDDYGLKDLSLKMDIDPVVEESPLGKVFETKRALEIKGPEEAKIQPVYDLTSHPWAGLPVILQLQVTDAANQQAETEIKLVLPEREFRHPVSKKLVALRKEMAWAPLANYEGYRNTIVDILTNPESYQADKLVFLTLTTAQARLKFAAEYPEEKITYALLDLLWKVALYLEDGEISLARENLRNIRRALEDALASSNPKNNPSENPEIQVLMQKFRQALSQYFEELQRELQKQAEGEQGNQIPREFLSQIISPENFNAFLQELEDALLTGDEDKAREILSRLSQFMDAIDPALAMQLPQNMQQMMEEVSEMQELIRKQEALLDKTRPKAAQQDVNEMPGFFHDMDPQSWERLQQQLKNFQALELIVPEKEQAEENAQRQKVEINTQDISEEQEALRYILGQMMREIGTALDQIPENLGTAERAMMRSQKALAQNLPKASIPEQELAIEKLREAMDQLSEQFMAQMQQIMGFSFSQNGQDPFGREQQGNNGPGLAPNSDVKLPNQSERKKAEEILELLRKKSGDFNRPEEELEYFQRLFKRF